MDNNRNDKLLMIFELVRIYSRNIGKPLRHKKTPKKKRQHTFNMTWHPKSNVIFRYNLFRTFVMEERVTVLLLMIFMRSTLECYLLFGLV